jgi:hypothetical protein
LPRVRRRKRLRHVLYENAVADGHLDVATLVVALPGGLGSESKVIIRLLWRLPREYHVMGKGRAKLSIFLKNLIVLAIVATFGAASASADIAVEVFTFTGQCTDCTGTGTGTLILLAGYELGTSLSADDLYSFNYSSNLTDLSIFNDPTAVLSGTLPVGLGPATISISGKNGSFNSNSDGAWSAYYPPADYGTNGIWTAGYPTPTPEPSALPVIGVCLAGVVFIGLRRVKVS